jgi:demethylmenaquinone methyltransferase/2-methoxy-6-polyprenyl-1,4-benzoquinol methylase
LARIYFGSVVPVLTRVGTGSQPTAELMRFYWETISQCVPPEIVLGSLARAGLAAACRQVLFGIFSEYSAHRAV